jgi:2'-hydroxyisoflavone reductase
MRLLLLGGPKFLGRAVIDAALARGDEVTLFNRGETNADLYPDVERLHGDRDGGLARLRGREWDVVVDTSGYVPRVVGQSAKALADSVRRYVFVSSISVYASFGAPVTEESPRAVLEDPSTEVVEKSYGALKAACEDVVDHALPGRAIHVRAGLIVGPHDPTGRFTYWPHRVASGGDVLVPAPLDRPVQFVDARDLAGWMLVAAEAGESGAFNATGPATMRDVISACCAATGSDVRVVEVDETFLRAHEVGQWVELPLWIDSGDTEWRAMMEVDTSRAHAARLRFRPLVETVRGTLEDARPVEGAGLTPEREQQLLEAWHARG